MNIKNIKNINFMPNNLSKLNKFCLTSVFIGTSFFGFIGGVAYGEAEEQKNILEETDEKVKAIKDLEQELTSDIVSLMKAKTQLSIDTNTEHNKNETTYRLDEIYVLDTNHNDIITFGESSNYAYPYVFTTCNEVPTIGGHDNHDSNPINGFYGILFADSYTCITSISQANTNGNFYIKNSGDYDEKLQHIDPLIYYLTEEEIKETYTERELKDLFYRLNSVKIGKGKVLENKQSR